MRKCAATALFLLTPFLAVAQTPSPVVATATAEDARSELQKLFNRYPPAVREILALDPALLANESYLSQYPELAAYVRSHPEIAHSPEFYIGSARREQRHPIVLDVLAGMAILTGIAMAVGLIVWVVRATLDHRRWNRVTRVQTETHTKLLDRLTQNDELLEYIRSTPGAKFLQGAPLGMDFGRAIGAPHGRILMSVQIGVILIAGGSGLYIARGQFDPEVVPVIYAAAVLAISLGAGFALSAVTSWVISRRLGLMSDTSR